MVATWPKINPAAGSWTKCWNALIRGSSFEPSKYNNTSHGHRGLRSMRVPSGFPPQILGPWCCFNPFPNKNANLTSTQIPANPTKPTPKKSFNKIWSANQLHSTYLTIKIKSHSLKNKNSVSNQNQHQTQNRTTSNETTPKSSPIQSAPTQSNPIQSNPIQLHIQPNFDSVKIKSLFYPAISRLVQTKPARASPPVRLRQNLLAMLPACKE